MQLQSGHWSVECLPEDGARIASLQFDGLDVLTTAPKVFQPPAKDFGRYETRPVYGYDDCFPTVDSCRFPVGNKFKIPDHGELCWLDWRVEADDNILDCCVKSSIMPVSFRRKMVFGESSLQWRFEVKNESGTKIPFLHAMHALMPLDQVAEIQVPEFGEVLDAMNGQLLPLQNSEHLSKQLLAADNGSAEMLLLREIKSGRASVVFKSGLNLEIEFPVDMFPTLGIWWNNAGYPDEDGCRRTEFALEPISGTTSSLETSYANGACLSVPADGRLEWIINWNIFN